MCWIGPVSRASYPAIRVVDGVSRQRSAIAEIPALDINGAIVVQRTGIIQVTLDAHGMVVGECSMVVEVADSPH